MEGWLTGWIRVSPGAPDPHVPRAHLGHLPGGRADSRNRALSSQKIQIEGPSPSRLWRTFASSDLGALP